jgi:hypothetical protein
MQDCGSIIGSAETADCVWMRFDVDASTRDEAEGFPATHETAHRYSMGRQTALDGDWTVGLGADFEHNDSAGFDGQWRDETTTFQVGLRGARAYGPTTVGGTLSLGNSEYFVQRAVVVTEPLLATSHRDVPFVAGLVDVARAFDAGSVKLTPALNLGVAYLSGERTKESGADGQNLVLARDDETSAWVEPAVDAAFTTTFGQDKALRLYARFGALYYLTDATTEVKAGFAAAPQDAAMMVVGSDLDDLHWLAEGGVELVATDRYTLSLSYGAQRSDLRDSDTGTVRIVIPLH